MARIFTVSLLLVLFSHFYVLRIQPGGEGYTAIGGDSIVYAGMVQGRDADAPFRFRILVPLTAKVLPFTPFNSLRAITYASLFFAYLFILLTCEQVGLDFQASVAGLVAVCLTSASLNYYHNPFLVDAFGVMCLSIMLYALVTRWFALFLITALIGVLDREQVIFLVPAWWVINRRQGAAAIALSLVFLLAPRAYLWGGHVVVNVFQYWSDYVKMAAAAFGMCWMFAFVGLERRLRISAALLLVGTTLTSLIVVDPGRMFSFLIPIMAILTAVFYSGVRSKSIFWVLVLAQGLIAIPNVILGIEEMAAIGLRVRAGIMAAGCLFALSAPMRSFMQNQLMPFRREGES